MLYMERVGGERCCRNNCCNCSRIAIIATFCTNGRQSVEEVSYPFVSTWWVAAGRQFFVLFQLLQTEITTRGHSDVMIGEAAFIKAI